jgi:hypothetical protein
LWCERLIGGVAAFVGTLIGVPGLSAAAETFTAALYWRLADFSLLPLAAEAFAGGLLQASFIGALKQRL